VIVRCPNCGATMVRCDRCGRPALIGEEELEAMRTDDGDQELPVMVPLMIGWIDTVEAGTLCDDCSTTGEVVEWMDRGSRIEEVLFGSGEVEQNEDG
jgi:hypothetical protein